jgi:hypothetical protein
VVDIVEISGKFVHTAHYEILLKRVPAMLLNSSRCAECYGMCDWKLCGGVVCHNQMH